MGSILNNDEAIRVSYGTAQVLDLKPGRSKEEPTTAYCLLPGKICRGGCTFCPQSRGEEKWLSRVSWPLYEIEKLKDRLKDSELSRICLQSPDIPDYEDRLKALVDELECTDKPISISAPPLEEKTLEELKDPVDRIGIGLDAATDHLRKEKKPNYDPLVFWNYLGKAVDIYGKKQVTAHLIVGLGESLEELGTAVNKAIKVGANVSLFSYTNDGEKADLIHYRRAQLLTALLEDGLKVDEAVKLVSDDPKRAFEEVDAKETFQTIGCPGCNRPYYTSSPGSEHRNFPREPAKEEIRKIKEDIVSGDRD